MRLCCLMSSAKPIPRMDHRSRTQIRHRRTFRLRWCYARPLMRAVSDLRSILSGGRGSLPATAQASYLTTARPRARLLGHQESSSRRAGRHVGCTLMRRPKVPKRPGLERAWGRPLNRLLTHALPSSLLPSFLRFVADDDHTMVARHARF